MKWLNRNWFALVLLWSIAICWVSYNVIAYGDWHCAISRCVRIGK